MADPYKDTDIGGLENSLKELVTHDSVNLHKSLKLEGTAFKLVFRPDLQIQYADGTKLAALERILEEERPECIIMRGTEGDNVFKVMIPGTSGLTDQAKAQGILHIGSLYAGVKGDSLAFVTHLIVNR
eukprot:m.328734 g.328734  ORF g.328734 m.328734 type:complete len:128 (-) comp16502_c1_seq37:157-540(-)